MQSDFKLTPEELKDQMFALAEEFDLVVAELSDAESAWKKFAKLELT
jgi:hypothetical protein